MSRKRAAPAQASSAQVVREYIDAHPSIKDCVRMGIINLSALARQVMRDEGIKSEEAALIACRRYELDPRQKINEEAILRVLRRSKLEIRTKVAIITVRPSWHIFAKLEKAMSALRGTNHPLHVIQGTASVTVITDGSVAKEIQGILGEDETIKTMQGLVELVVTSPDVIEDIPGILAYLATALSSKGINFLEVISCYKDTMFVIEESDMVGSFETLNRLIAG
ncbi:MAG TPA: ACT domain-containing protein [Candidatus Thermoplasmatota archaeon]|nr:ACT domain-containing protein [Candidatus Thermoplasmatota archaeon]